MRLKFDGEEEKEEGRRKNENNQLVLEALQPPLNLKELEIWSYRGNIVSPRMMQKLKEFTNLRSLTLFKTAKIESSCLLWENCDPLKISAYCTWRV